MAERGVVAGTIMVTNAQGETYFLVDNRGESISFLSAKSEIGGKLPTGVIMEHLLKFVNVQSDSFRLMDLAHLKADTNNVSLFVFDLVERPEDPNVLLAGTEDVAWRRSKELTTLLDRYDYGTVPVN